MKQTAIEWLVEQLEKNKFITKSQIFIAEEMEKHQIVKAAASAYEDMFGTDGTEYGEKYYDKLTQES